MRTATQCVCIISGGAVAELGYRGGCVGISERLEERVETRKKNQSERKRYTRARHLLVRGWTMKTIGEKKIYKYTYPSTSAVINHGPEISRFRYSH